MELLSRISIDPTIMHGKPIISVMQWTVEMILDLLAAGMTKEEILEDHPELEKEDILACLKYARLQLS